MLTDWNHNRQIVAHQSVPTQHWYTPGHLFLSLHLLISKDFLTNCDRFQIADCRKRLHKLQRKITPITARDHTDYSERLLGL